MTSAGRTGFYEIGLTLKLEGGALACGNVSADLANVVERDGDLFLVTTGHAVCEDVDVVSVLEEIERSLEDANMRLNRY